MEGRLTWEEIVERYPDRWVGLRDCVMDGADIVSAVVECVCTDDEQDAKICEYARAKIGLTWDRTTEVGGVYLQWNV